MANMAGPAPFQLTTSNAVILVPGIGGSELRDPRTEKLVWGMHATTLAHGFLSGSVFSDLERGDLEVGEVLQTRGFLSRFGRLDHYQPLTNELRGLCDHPDAFATYPYDWRLPVAATAAGLAEFAHRHLQTWRNHPNNTRKSKARLCLVGHSMGGLLACRAATGLPRDDVALLITLGTPFKGSVRAAQAIANGDIAPHGAFSNQIAELTRNIASVYDLLPSEPALTTDPDQPKTAVAATDADFAAIGGRQDLLSERTHFGPDETKGLSDRLVAIVGITQPTLQSFTVNHGEAAFFTHIDGQDFAGDGTVSMPAAYPTGHTAVSNWPLQHGSMGNTSEAIASVAATIQQRALGAGQGQPVGLHTPDTVVAGDAVPITVRSNTPSVDLTIRDMTGRTNSTRVDLRNGHSYTTAITLQRPGLYEITANAGGASPITCDILALEPT